MRKTKAREKGAAREIIGCDVHPSYQPVAWLDTESREVREATLAHENGEARRFYESLRGPVRVGLEAVGNTQWFERLLAGLGHEVWIGDAAHIRALVVLPQGAVVSIGARIGLGEELNLVNLKTGDEVDCRVVGLKLGDDGKNNVEIEFLQEATSFWPVSFPGDVPRGRGKEAQMAPVRN